MDKVISARGKSSGIGFGADVSLPEDRATGEILKDLQPEDLLKFGLIPEFIGRLPIHATLDDLDRAALKRILVEPKNALLKQYERLFEMEDVRLRVEEGAMNAIVDLAVTRKTGARGLRSIMETILLDSMFTLPSEKDVVEVIVTEDTVRHQALPLKITGKRQSLATASTNGAGTGESKERKTAVGT